MWRKGIFSTGTSTVEISMEVLKTKNRNTIGHSNSTSGIYSKKAKSLNQKDICLLMFTATLLNMANIWN